MRSSAIHYVEREDQVSNPTATPKFMARSIVTVKMKVHGVSKDEFDANTKESRTAFLGLLLREERLSKEERVELGDAS